MRSALVCRGGHSLTRRDYMEDSIVAPDKWVFNEDVADCFENMLQRSIPQYQTMRDLVYDIGNLFITNGSSVLDIGCSDGLSLSRFVDKHRQNNKFIGIDVSEPMLSKAKARFSNEIKEGTVDICNVDLRDSFPHGEYSLITSVLTVQFTPIEYRQSIIQRIYDKLEANGCFIMVEKVLGECDVINEIMVNTYLSSKESNGYSQQQIERKRRSLEGVLVPVTSKWNKELLRQAGFSKVDSFWRWMNFEGYIAVKGGK